MMCRRIRYEGMPILIQKLGFSFVIALPVAVVIGLAGSMFRLSYLDALFLDTKNYLTAPSFARKDIVSISISELKDRKSQMPVRDLALNIQKISEWNPRLIILAMGADEISDVEELSPVMDALPNLYLYSKWNDDRSFSKSQLQNHARNLSLKHTVDSTLPPYDHKTRRFVLSMDKDRKYDVDLLKFNSIIPMFDPDESFENGILRIYDTKQINLRFFQRNSVPEISLSKIQPSDIRKKIVILTTNDNHSGNIKHPYTRFRYEEESSTSDYFSYGSYLMNVYANLKDRDYVREPTRAQNVVWIIFFCFFNTLMLLFLRKKPKKYIIWSFLVIPLEFFVGLLVFKLTSLNFDFSRIFLSQVVTQYVGIPLLLIDYLRRSDAEKLDFQNRADREKIKMKFSVKLAEAEMSMKVAAKVSHDLRSPIMALQIASEFLKGKIDDEVGKLITDSTARVSHIADDTLKIYKGKQRNLNTPVQDCREIVEELVNSYRQLYPSVHFSINEGEFAGVQIPYYSVQRMISNIFNNAIEAGASKIIIDILMTQEFIQMEISNDGPAIPSDIRNKLFQERATFGKARGTGLGLYQIRTEIESYGGNIGLKADTETCFVMSIPTEYKPLVIPLTEKVLILEPASGDISNEISKPDFLKSTFANVEDALELIRGIADDSSQWTVLVDLAHDDGKKTAFDFLESVQGKNFRKIWAFSTVVDSPEILRIAEFYGVTLVEKWRLAVAINNQMAGEQ